MSFAGVSFSYAPGNQHQSGTLGKAPQLVERVIANDGVRGSIPLSGQPLPTVQASPSF